MSKRRSNLGTLLTEALQFLKHNYKEDRLDLAARLIATEREMTADAHSIGRVKELLSAGNYGELRTLLSSS